MAQIQDAILREIKNLEPLPRVALRVLELGARDEVIPRELVAVIETDAAMTAKVLRLCNSAYYGFRREIASLHDAGNMLGVSTLVNLVLTSCTARHFRRFSRGDELKSQAMWEASVSNALCASLLARLSGSVDHDRAYTAGLLQNIGQVVIERYLMSEEKHLRDAVASGTALIEAERLVLGLDHAEVGARMCERWNFPEVLSDAVRYHHEPDRAQCDPLLTSFVHLGDQVTLRLALEKDPSTRVYALDDIAFERTGLDARELASVEPVLAREVERAREFVDAH